MLTSQYHQLEADSTVSSQRLWYYYEVSACLTPYISVCDIQLEARKLFSVVKMSWESMPPVEQRNISRITFKLNLS